MAPAARPSARKAAAKPAVPAKQTAPRAAKKVSPHDAALAKVRAICLAWSEVTVEPFGAHWTFRVRKKTFAYFLDDHHGDGRLAVWCKAPPGAQPMLVESDPARFFVPPYMGPRGWVGARLDGGADWAAIGACLEEAYRMSAPKVRGRKA
jgi:hypothetical protein